MIAKDKAKALVNKFVDKNIYEENPTDAVAIAKTSALICVDEIISKGGTKNVIQYEPNCFTNGVEYWQEVKQEIYKL